MKCKICGHGINAYQIKYGDANPPQRDENGMITSRGFHHDCVYALEEKEQLEAEHKAIEAQEAARYLGSIKSEKKAKSSAENGKLGGRPKSKGKDAN